MAEGYERLRLLWPDHLGLARGKYLPSGAHTETGHCISLFTLGYDREMIPHDGGMFWEGLPDLEASYDPADARPGWEPDTTVIIPEISRKGEPVPLTPRNLLRSALEQWEPHGVRPKVGIELEAYGCQPPDQEG